MKYSKLSLVAGVVLILFAVAGHADDKKKEPLSKPKAVPVVVEKKPAIEMTQTKPATGEEINWHVISCGGTGGDSPSYGHAGTAGQTAVGVGASANYRLSGGFWPDFSPTSCCVGLTGNVDGDPTDMVDLGDLTALIDYLFISFTPPACMEEANCDGSIDGMVDLGDLTMLIDYLFISFTPLAPCGGGGSQTKSVPVTSSQVEVVCLYSDGATTVMLKNGMDLRGIQLELAGENTANPTSLLEGRLDMFFGRKSDNLVVGLVDSDGGEMIKAGEQCLIRLEGQYEVVSAVVSDRNHSTLAATIGALKTVSLPTVFALHQNYPNPFNPVTEIGFSLPEATHVRLEIYNVMGQRVVALIDRELEAGEHTVTWDGRESASGVYLYRLKAGDFTDTKKMILLK